MAGEFVKSVVGAVAGAMICGLLGWAVFALHDDYVIRFVMPPMVDPNGHPPGPLLVKLDDRYALKPEESTDNAGDTAVQRTAVDDIEEELRALRHVVDQLRDSVEQTGSQVEPATSPVDPPQKIEGVRLYLSTVEGEEDLVVLNGDSPRLAQDIRYGALYGVSLAGGQFSEDDEGLLRAELQRLDAPGQGGYAAIGRIPIRHFEKLGGRSRGYVVADLHLLGALSPRP